MVAYLFTSHFQPSPNPSNTACNTGKRRAECTDLPLKAHSLHSKRYAVPSQGRRCFWIPWGPNTECARATQRWSKQKRTKLPMAVKADGVVKGMYVPIINQAEEEKTPVDQVDEEKTPNGCESRRGHNTFIG